MSLHSIDTQQLIDLATHAISPAPDDQKTHGVIAALQQKSVDARRDIPAAFEAYSLLLRALDRHPAQAIEDGSTPSQEAGVYVLNNHYVICATPIEAGMLRYEALWATEYVFSEKLKDLPGTLMTLFEVEHINEQQHLFPEWFSIFIDHQDGRFPLLTMRSVLADERFNDWVKLAHERMGEYGF